MCCLPPTALGSFLLLVCLVPLYLTYDEHASALEAAALAAEPPLNTTERLIEMQRIIALAEELANAGSNSWDGDPLSALPRCDFRWFATVLRVFCGCFATYLGLFRRPGSPLRSCGCPGTSGSGAFVFSARLFMRVCVPKLMDLTGTFSITTT